MELGECRVSKYTGLSPQDDYIVVERADRHVLVSDAVLAECDERFAHFGDGIFTIHARDGDVSYGLSHYNPLTRTWLGTRGDRQECCKICGRTVDPLNGEELRFGCCSPECLAESRQ